MFRRLWWLIPIMLLVSCGGFAQSDATPGTLDSDYNARQAATTQGLGFKVVGFEPPLEESQLVRGKQYSQVIVIQNTGSRELPATFGIQRYGGALGERFIPFGQTVPVSGTVRITVNLDLPLDWKDTVVTATYIALARQDGAITFGPSIQMTWRVQSDKPTPVAPELDANAAASAQGLSFKVTAQNPDPATVELVRGQSYVQEITIQNSAAAGSTCWTVDFGIQKRFGALGQDFIAFGNSLCPGDTATLQIQVDVPLDWPNDHVQADYSLTTRHDGLSFGNLIPYNWKVAAEPPPPAQ